MYDAIAPIMERARDCGGDASRIVLTGDSTGGHLASAVSLMLNMVGDGGYGKPPNLFSG